MHPLVCPIKSRDLLGSVQFWCRRILSENVHANVLKESTTNDNSNQGSDEHIDKVWVIAIVCEDTTVMLYSNAIRQVGR